jgi:hypothetical protein
MPAVYPCIGGWLTALHPANVLGLLSQAAGLRLPKLRTGHHLGHVTTLTRAASMIKYLGV